VLRAVEARHWKVGGFGDRVGGMYRIKDELGFAVRLEEWRRGAAEGGGWVPFEADDVQVELRMLDPYVRKALKHLGKGEYEVQMTAPDVSGVFKFQLDYQRPGLTHLHLEEPAPIRPYRHNEFERFIPAAFPYYAAIACSGAGFFIFSAVLLYFRSPDGSSEAGLRKKQE
jgi:oligosaccharyltransferase complex subunit beta